MWLRVLTLVGMGFLRSVVGKDYRPSIVVGGHWLRTAIGRDCQLWIVVGRGSPMIVAGRDCLLSTAVDKDFPTRTEVGTDLQMILVDLSGKDSVTTLADLGHMSLLAVPARLTGMIVLSLPTMLALDRLRLMMTTTVSTMAIRLEVDPDYGCWTPMNFEDWQLQDWSSLDQVTTE